MISVNQDQFIWVEKYRPKKLSECILPESIKSVAAGFIEEGRLPSMLLSGNAGVGKTTLAKALCEEVGADWILINASSDAGIDMFRTKITQFATSVSFDDAKKVVILDEADNASVAFQNALRSGMEAVSSNCSFVITCNYPNRIIDPIHSRCVPIKFKIEKDEQLKLQAQFFKRICQILDLEEVEYDKKIVAELIKNQFPDFRKCLYTLQKYSVVGKIDSGILIDRGDDALNQLATIMKEKKFNSMRQWVADHADMTPEDIIMMFYRGIEKKLAQKSLPEFIICLGDFTNNVSRSINPEVTLVAFLTTLLASNLDWQS